MVRTRSQVMLALDTLLGGSGSDADWRWRCTILSMAVTRYCWWRWFTAGGMTDTVVLVADAKRLSVVRVVLDTLVGGAGSDVIDDVADGADTLLWWFTGSLDTS